MTPKRTALLHSEQGLLSFQSGQRPQEKIYRGPAGAVIILQQKRDGTAVKESFS